jgi:flagellin-like hook-associated protein FlgL
LSEYEFSNVLDASYAAYVVNGSRSGHSNSATSQGHDDVVATIRELVNGKTADIRLSAKNASTVVSVVQTFAGAAESIAIKLAEIESLAKKASGMDYSSTQVDDMQKEFKRLAKEINGIIKSTESEFNNLFTSTGKAISISIGDGSKVDIFARDLSFDATGLDLAANPKAALSNVKKAIKELSEYRGYLNKEAALVEELTAIIESETESAMGVELDDFTSEVALETDISTARQLSQNSSNALDAQANTVPSVVLQLLRDGE